MKKTKEWNRLKHENLEDKRNESLLEWKSGMKIWNEICLVFKGEQHLIEQGHRTFHSIF